jgi:hypothetical protein
MGAPSRYETRLSDSRGTLPNKSCPEAFQAKQGELLLGLRWQLPWPAQPPQLRERIIGHLMACMHGDVQITVDAGKRRSPAPQDESGSTSATTAACCHLRDIAPKDCCPQVQ